MTYEVIDDKETLERDLRRLIIQHEIETEKVRFHKEWAEEITLQAIRVKKALLRLGKVSDWEKKTGLKVGFLKSASLKVRSRVIQHIQFIHAYDEWLDDRDREQFNDLEYDQTLEEILNPEVR